MSSFFRPGKHHCIWKEWRRIGQGKESNFFLEHRQAVLESLRGEHPPLEVLLSERLYLETPERWEKLALKHPSCRWFLVGEVELNRITSVAQSSGLCGVYSPRPYSFEELCLEPFIFVAWRLSDPGNLGTIIRAQRAFAGGALLSIAGCHPWSSKVARSSAGYLLGSRVCRIADEEKGLAMLGELRKAGYELYAALARADHSLDKVSWGARAAVLLGNETQGLPLEVVQMSSSFTIPSSSEVESINVAMSASIIAWEWRRSHENFSRHKAGMKETAF